MKKALRTLVALVVLVAISGGLVFLAHKGTPGVLLSWRSSLTAVSTWWEATKPTTRELIGVAVAALAVFVALIAAVFTIASYLLQRRKEAAGGLEPRERSFPFEIFSTSEIDVLKKRFLGQYASLEYQRRFSLPRQVSFEADLDAKFLILTGRTGLGKTRECVELFRRLAETKGEEVTIICPRPDFDRPTDWNTPSDFAPRNPILFVDDIHDRCVPAQRKSIPGEATIRTFQDRLSATVAWMEERFAGRDWRVVLTTRDEPEFGERVQLDAAVWSRFKKYALPGIHRDARPAFIRSVAEHFGLGVEDDAVRQIAKQSDGTCLGIITVFARESSRRSARPSVLTLGDLAGYHFRYPDDWEHQVYAQTIAPYPERRSVFEALSGLSQLHVPPYLFFVTDIAARICLQGHFRWLRVRWLRVKKRRIRRTIRRDLRAWIFEYRGEVFCPYAYVEGKAKLSTILPEIITSFKHFAGGKKSLATLLPVVVGASCRLGLDLGLLEDGLRVLDTVEATQKFAPLWTARAVLLGRLGRSHESLQAAEAAVRADNQNVFALVALAYAQSQVGSHDRAIHTAREATNATPENDFAWLNLGVVLSKRGLHKEGISALARACQLNPQNAKAWYSLGVAYDRGNRLTDAIEACNRAVELAPLDGDAWHILGIVFDRANERDKALNALRHALQLDDADGSKWFSLSRALFSAGQTDEAFAALAGAGKRAAGNADLLGGISIAYGKNGRHDQAVTVAKEALKIDPQHVGARRSLAINLGKLAGQEEEAQRARLEFEKLCSTADDWCDLSVAYGTSGHPEEAVRAGRKAVEIDAKHVGARRSLAINLACLPGREEEALWERRRLADLANTADDWCDLSTAYREAGLYKEAVESADKALAIDPVGVRPWRLRGISLDGIGRSEEALASWRRLDELTGRAGATSYAAEADRALQEAHANPASDSAWRQVAYTYRRAGRAAEAVSVARGVAEAFQLAAPHTAVLAGELLRQEPRAVEALMEYLLTLDPRNGQYLHLLGAARMKAGDLKKALEPLQAACELDPAQANYWYALGEVLENSGSRDPEALDSYKKAVQLKPDYMKARLGLTRLARKLGIVVKH
jgi:tetratricopeptide (TPR) repeat protein